MTDTATLDAYCKGFAVGIIPYIVNERMHYVNPLKLREYLSAGLPVVSTAVPEVLSTLLGSKSLSARRVMMLCATQ